MIYQTTIRVLEPEPEPPPPSSTTQIGVATRGQAGAIVTGERDPEGRALVIEVERFSYAVEPIVARLTALRTAEPDAAVIVDVEGIGDALWELLGRPRRPWHLYAKHGTERQELSRALLVIVAQDRLRFGEVAEAEAMKKALAALTRDPREDGPGSDLTTALALAVGDFRPRPPRIG